MHTFKWKWSTKQPRVNDLDELFFCRNLNIGFATKCEVQKPMWLKVCLSMKHTLTNGGECKGWKPNDSKVHSHSGSCINVKVTSVQSLG